MNYKEIERTGKIATKWIGMDLGKESGRICQAYLSDLLHYKRVKDDGLYLANYREVLKEFSEEDVSSKTRDRINNAINATS